MLVPDWTFSRNQNYASEQFRALTSPIRCGPLRPFRPWFFKAVTPPVTTIGKKLQTQPRSLNVDRRDRVAFLQELNTVAEACHPQPNALFRLVIEETEARSMGDRNALLSAYPRPKTEVLDRYVQDSACRTWELLADALFPGSSTAIERTEWPLPGQIKHEWAEKSGPLMSPELNASPSFSKFRVDLLRLVS